MWGVQVNNKSHLDGVSKYTFPSMPDWYPQHHPQNYEMDEITKHRHMIYKL
jgi:hypothetical protein